MSEEFQALIAPAFLPRTFFALEVLLNDVMFLQISDVRSCLFEPLYLYCRFCNSSEVLMHGFLLDPIKEQDPMKEREGEN